MRKISFSLFLTIWATVLINSCLTQTSVKNETINYTSQIINNSLSKVNKINELTLSGVLLKAREKESLVLKCPLDESVSSEIFDEINDYEEETDSDYEIENEEGEKIVKKRNITPLKQQQKQQKENKFVIVQWFKDSIRINKLTSSPRYKTHNAFLRIKNLNPNDSGNFKCKIINGFGSSTFGANLIVESSGKNRLIASSLNIKKQGQKMLNEMLNKALSAPVFNNLENIESRYFKRMKGTQIKLKCKAQANPKPEILWFKNGEILSEEEYGITRSKWTLELKDLRMSDNGNFTCQVFNKHGVINATFELVVYEDSQIFEGHEPFNTTIISGMNAVFTCKVKSHTLPNIKWMKQISKAEYANYVLQNNGDEELNDPTAELGLNQNENNNNNQNSFYLNTQSPLSLIKTLDENNNNNNNNNDFDNSISDLMGTENAEPMLKDDYENYKVFLTAKKLLESKKPSIDNLNEIDESVHYITLTSSPFTEQQVTFNEKENYYISQLTIKQASVKDTGIYVCFGANTKGYSYRKAFLKVIQQQQQQQPKQPQFILPPLPPATFTFKKFDELLPKQNTEINYQSMGVLIVLIPVVLITTFAVVSICLLKRLNDHRKNEMSKTSVGDNEPKETLFSLVKRCLFKCCLKKNRHELIRNSETLDVKTKFNDRKRNHNKHGSFPSSTTNSLGSSMSDTSSTTATTVAYYATIPLLIDNQVLPQQQQQQQQPPPPLPNTQPPSVPQQVVKNCNLVRTESTPSMAYYKIVETDLVDEMKQRMRGDDALTCISANSRLYYQLTPTNFHQN